MEENEIKNKNGLPGSPEENQNDSPEKYYNGTAEKFKGIGLGILIEAIGFVSFFRTFTIILITFVLYVGLIIWLYYKGKNDFAMGLIIALLIPVAIFGGCLLLISGKF